MTPSHRTTDDDYMADLERIECDSWRRFPSSGHVSFSVAFAEAIDAIDDEESPLKKPDARTSLAIGQMVIAVMDYCLPEHRSRDEFQ